MITFSELDDKCMDVFDKMELMESAAVKLIHKSSSAAEDEEVDDGLDLKHSEETLSTDGAHILPKPNLEDHLQKVSSWTEFSSERRFQRFEKQETKK